MHDFDQYAGCRTEKTENGWRVCRRDGSVIEPWFGTWREADNARAQWQRLADRVALSADH